MKDVFRDPQVRAFLDQFAKEGLPAIMDSGTMMAIVHSKPDPQMCLEIGAAVLLDKPIIVCVPEGEKVPENLRKCAQKIITMGPGGWLSEEAKGEIEDFVYGARSKPSQGQ